MSYQVVERTAQFLTELNLLSGYSVRYHRWYDDDVDGNTPIALFRVTGSGNSDTFKQEYDVTLTLLASGPDKLVDLGDDMHAVSRAVRGKQRTTDVVKFDALGNQQGPFYLENDRPLYQLNIRVIVVDQ